MSTTGEPWHIVGQGLAGTCLAWHFLDRGAECVISSDGRDGSSRVAAGLVNPVTGKNFAPSWRVAEFLPEAAAFYQKIESLLGIRCWHPLPVVRLARDAKEWRRIEERLARPDTKPWVVGSVGPPPGWRAAVELCGGGRLDTRMFLDASRAHFEGLGIHRRAGGDSEALGILPAASERTVLCQGASGLLENQLGPHRCAKGEILTLEAPGWAQAQIRIGGGGWLVPIGGGRFKAGSTYEWDTLDSTPTDAGLERVTEIARALGGDDHFTILAHEAGVRPILRRSEPLIGRHPVGGWVFNGLGSKGSLYAPGCGRRLATACLDGTAIEAELDFQTFADRRI
ncbi:MAG: NAD(P)/FAD-dependent oxidoreductase [Luteolibacter sp.]